MLAEFFWFRRENVLRHQIRSRAARGNQSTSCAVHNSRLSITRARTVGFITGLSPDVTSQSSVHEHHDIRWLVIAGLYA